MSNTTQGLYSVICKAGLGTRKLSAARTRMKDCLDALIQIYSIFEILALLEAD